jgi:hypothetical protein
MMASLKIDLKHQVGFSIVELMIGLVAGGLVLAGAYSLWTMHNTQAYRLGKKVELSNQISLSSKKIQRAITMAGMGLDGAANLAKEDEVGSDSLIIYTNPNNLKTAITMNVTSASQSVLVNDPNIFNGAGYLALSSGGSGEIRTIIRIDGHSVFLNAPFTRTFTSVTTIAFPASRECYFTNQETNELISKKGETQITVAKNIRNFQVSFRNKNGESTEIQKAIRTVQFSFTGVFPAEAGALSSLVFSSTAIPRNIL